MGKVRVFSQLSTPTATEFSLQNIPLLGLPEVPWWFVSVNKVLLMDNGGQRDTKESVQLSASKALQSQRGAGRG